MRMQEGQLRLQVPTLVQKQQVPYRMRLTVHKPRHGVLWACRGVRVHELDNLAARIKYNNFKTYAVNLLRAWVKLLGD